jgi:hypothetical protein
MTAEIQFSGHRFSSLVEARWAAFFEAAGLIYEYRKRGFNVNRRGHVPCFWLSSLNTWFEVAELNPPAFIRRRCNELAVQSMFDVLLAVGAPEPREQIYRFRANGDSDGPWFFADDRRNEGEFWLMADSDGRFEGHSIGAHTGPDHDRYPLVHSATKLGYEAAVTAFAKGTNSI